MSASKRARRPDPDPLDHHDVMIALSKARAMASVLAHLGETDGAIKQQPRECATQLSSGDARMAGHRRRRRPPRGTGRRGSGLPQEHEAGRRAVPGRRRPEGRGVMATTPRGA